MKKKNLKSSDRSMRSEAKKKRLERSALIRRISHGTYRHFAFGILGIIAAIVSQYCIPLITSFTIDYVLKDYADVSYSGSIVISPWLESLLSSLGGKEFLIRNFYLMALALIFMTAINAVSIYLRKSQVAKGSEKLAYNMRTMLYEHLANMPYDYHKHVSSGDIVQRCTSDVDTIRRFVQNQLLEIVRTVMMIIVAAYIMFSMNVTLSLASIIMMPFLALASYLYCRGVKKHFALSDEAEGALSAAIQENVTGVRVVRAFGQQRSELDSFTEKNNDYKQKSMKLNDIMALFWGFSDMFGYIQIAISLCLGIYFVLKGKISVGEMLVFSSYTSMLVWPVRQLGRILADLEKAGVSLGRLNDIITVPVESEPGKALKPEIHGSVEFRDVGFGYEEGQEVLNNISFKAEAGETIAILGSTGSGKSSLVQLLQGLYTVREGEILIDGMNINDIERHHLRRNIGIVLQEPFLYSRTIMENIRIATPEAAESEVYDAASVASIHEVVKSFEKGYDTVVGEKGVTLSGGQKQRVAIARMLMQKAPIIILDDSMSAVDTETDAAIRDALSSRRDGCTTFIISHRITTLCRADKILVLEGGRLVQMGTHDELVKKDGLYKRIADIQTQLEDEMEEEAK